MVKLRFNFASYTAGDDASPTAIANTFALNDLSQIYTNADTISKGYLTYPKLFRRCRVNGVLAKFTVFQLIGGSASYPSIAFMQPYSTAEGAPTSTMRVASTLKQQRWTKTGYVKNWGYGGGPTTIKQFFSIKKMSGSDLARTDMNYASITDVTGNPYNSPANIWYLVAGMTTAAQVALSSTQSYHYNLELTYYVEYFEQVREQQGL